MSLTLLTEIISGYERWEIEHQGSTTGGYLSMDLIDGKVYAFAVKVNPKPSEIQDIHFFFIRKSTLLAVDVLADGVPMSEEDYQKLRQKLNV